MRSFRCCVLLCYLTTTFFIAGCTDSSDSQKNEVTSILRANRNAQPDLATQDFHVYRETMASLLTSQYVLNAALRQPDLQRLKGISTAALRKAISVELSGDSELIAVTMPIGRWKPDDAERVLNAVIQAFESEVVNKERLETVDTLTKLRKRYQVLFDTIRKKSDEITALGKQLGSTSNSRVDFRLTQIVKKLDRCEARLLDLQLQEIALKHAGDQTALVINNSQREMLQSMIEELKETSSNLGQSSGDLEARKDDLVALRRDLQLVRADMQKLEIELDGPKRISIIQRATTGEEISLTE